jgi:hypothetical protein
MFGDGCGHFALAVAVDELPAHTLQLRSGGGVQRGCRALLARSLQRLDLSILKEGQQCLGILEVVLGNADETTMAACYHATDGRPADDPVVLLKIGFLQTHDNLSDRADHLR